MFFKLILLAFIATNAAIQAVTSEDHVPIEDYPSFISLEYNNVHRCSGAIVARYYAVTAARCTSGENDQFRVRAGTANKEQGGIVYRVKNIIKHDNFTNENELPVNDIAIIHLKDPFIFDNRTNKIDLMESGKELDGSCLLSVVGYGLNGQGFRQQLKAHEVRKESEHFCDLYYETDVSQICSGYLNWPGKNASLGDIGDPMYYENRLVGILSHLRSYGKLPYPEVYTKISHFRKWLDDNIDY